MKKDLDFLSLNFNIFLFFSFSLFFIKWMKQGGQLLNCLFTGNSVYMVFCYKRIRNLLPQRSSRAHSPGSFP